MDRVTRSFYRILLRVARTHDTNPALKGILVLPRTSYYDKFKRQWLEVKEPRADPESRMIRSYVRDLLGGGMFYLPEVRAADLVRNAFRHAHVANSPAGVLGGGDAAAVGLDVAAAVIRTFERNLAKGREIGVHEGRAPGGAPDVAPAERSYDVERAREPAKGSVLLAHPLQAQGNLTRSATLIIKHDQGTTLGLVVNRRVPFTVGDLIDTREKNGLSASARESLAAFRDNVVFRGGDVGEAFMSVLHPHGELKGAQRVCEGVFWQCEMEDAIELINSGKAQPADFKIFLGYAGWGAGQLEGELRMNSWLAVRDKEGGDAVKKLAFCWGNETDTLQDEEYAKAVDTWMDEESWGSMVDKKASSVWACVWKSLGGEYAQLTRVPMR